MKYHLKYLKGSEWKELVDNYNKKIQFDCYDSAKTIMENFAKLDKFSCKWKLCDEHGHEYVFSYYSPQHKNVKTGNL